MPENAQNTKPEPGPPDSPSSIDAENTAPKLAQRIVSLARDCQDTRQLWQAFADAVGNSWSSPFTTVRLTLPGGSVEAEFASEESLKPAWRAIVLPEITAAMDDGKSVNSAFVEQRSGLQICLHTVPVIDDKGIVRGAVCVARNYVNSQMADQSLSQLETLLTLFVQARQAVIASNSTSQQNAPNAAEGARPHSPEGTAEGGGPCWSTVQSAELASQFESVEQLAFSITNILKTRLGCIEVTLGKVAGPKVKLLAVSGTDNVFPRTPGSIRIRQAMEECLDHASPILAQNQEVIIGDQLLECLPLHRSWRRHTDNSNCLSLPITRNGKIVAIVSLRRNELLPFESQEVVAIGEQLSPLGTAIGILIKAHRSVVGHALEAFQAGVSRSWNQQRSRTLIGGLIVVLSVIGLASPWPQRLHVSGKVEADEARIYSAPIEGKLAEVTVKPGDTIKAGQLLLKMETDELTLRREQLLAQLSQRRVQMVAALTAHDATEAAGAKSELDRIVSELKTIDQQVADSFVTAHRDGVVTEGDGHLRTGESLPLGEPVVKVAETIARHVQLKVPDSIAGRVKPGQVGWVAAIAQPNLKIPVHVTRVYNRASIEDGKNFVLADAVVAANQPLSIPLGGEVHAQLNVGQQPGWWLLLDKPLRMLQWQTWQF